MSNTPAATGVFKKLHTAHSGAWDRTHGEVLCFMCAHTSMTHAPRLLPIGPSTAGRREPTPQLWPDRRRAGHRRSRSVCRRPRRLAAPPMTATASAAARAATRTAGGPATQGWFGMNHRDELARSASEAAEPMLASSTKVAGSSTAGLSSWPSRCWRRHGPHAGRLSRTGGTCRGSGGWRPGRGGRRPAAPRSGPAVQKPFNGLVSVDLLVRDNG
jgi:hypothetical protein